ncbi:MAG: hypothetical protein ACK40D_02085 [Cyanobacteriota bacterium]|jgi:WD40 repeat protein
MNDESQEQQQPFYACPYKGLIPFGEDDAPIFFGREKWCTIIADNLLASPLTLLYGPSGVGKSSVLQAGVVSRMRAQSKRKIDNCEPLDWVVIVCRDWRDDPLQTLCSRILAEIEALTGRPLPLADEASHDLCALLKAANEAIGRRDESGQLRRGKVLLILDQFEEYFLYHPQESGPSTFAWQFPRALEDPQLSLNVMLSLRDDSLAKLDRFKQEIPSLFANRLQIDHLDREAAIDAIRKPVEEFNRHLPPDSRKASVEPQLIQDVLEQVKVGQIQAGRQDDATAVATPAVASESTSGSDDVATLRVETPFLQLVMTRLWDEESRVEAPPRLRQDTLSRLGGAGKIVRDHLESLMQGLPESSKRVAAIIFNKLVTSGLTKIAYPVFELTDPQKVERPEDLLNRQELEELLDHLSGGSQRILRPLPSSLEEPNSKRYEIFHDVLAKPILEWRRKYQQQAERDAERKKHAEELERERQLRRKVKRRSFGVGALLLMIIVFLGRRTYQLIVKENKITVIESAQQFRVQQLDQIDALAQALTSAHWLIKQAPEINAAELRNVGSNLRQILDHIDEHFKAQLMSDAERRNSPPGISKIRLQSQDVGILSRNGTFLIRDFQGHPRPLPPGLGTTTAPVRVNPGDGAGSPLQRLIGWLPRSPQVLTGQAKPLASASGNLIKVFAMAESGGRIAMLSKASSPEELLLQVWEPTGQRPLYQNTIRASGPPTSKGTSPSMSQFQLRRYLAFSPDGRRLAVAARDGLRLIDFANPLAPRVQVVDRLKNQTLARFSGDGERLAVADSRGRVEFLDPADGSMLRGEGPIQLPESASFIFSLEFAPKRSRIAIASRDGKVRLFDPQGRMLQELNLGRIFQLRFSPDGRLLAVGSRDGSSSVLDLQAPAAKQVVKRFLNQASVIDIQFSEQPRSAAAGSAGGQQLITMSAAGTLHTWRVPPVATAPSLSQPSQQLSTLAFSLRSESLAWARVGSDVACLLPLADVPLGQGEAATLPLRPCDLWLRPPDLVKPLQPTDLSRLKFSGDGQTLVGLAWDGSGVLWNRKGQRLASLKLPKAAVPPFSPVSFSPGGRYFAFVSRGGGGSGGQDDELAMVLCEPRKLNAGNLSCEFARKPKTLPQTNGQRSLDLTGVQFLRRPRAGWPEVALTVADGWLCFANLKQDRVLAIHSPCLNIPSGQGELVASSDDSMLGLAGTDGRLYLWRRQGNSYRKVPASPIKVSAGPLVTVSFDPKNYFLATVSLDGTVALWDRKGRQLALFTDESGAHGGYLGAEFRDNGELLMWSMKGVLRQERVQDLPALIARGCTWLREYRAWLKDYRSGGGPHILDQQRLKEEKQLRFCDAIKNSND